jgi:tetratricopeptide (TPR) repeat protein
MVVLMTTLFVMSAVPAAAQQADADVLTAEAALAYHGQRYEDALKLIQKALGFDPRNQRALYYLGLIQLARQQPDQAAGALETLQSLRPSDPDITYQLGVAHFAAGNYDKAAPFLEEAFRQQPSRDNLGYYVGFVRYRRRDYDGAAAAFAANRSADPTMRQLALFYRGLTLGTLGLSEEAQAELSTAQQIQPMSPLTGASVRIQEALAAGGTRRILRRQRRRQPEPQCASHRGSASDQTDIVAGFPGDSAC